MGPCHQMGLLHHHTTVSNYSREEQQDCRAHAGSTVGFFFFFYLKIAVHTTSGSGYKTTLGFLFNEVEVKDDRNIANGSASCLNWNTLTPQRGVGSQGNEQL